MAYASLSDVFVRYRPITTMVGTAGYTVTSLEVSSVFIWQSEAYVDAWLARRYAVPLAVVNPLITQVTADLAIFHMLAEKLPDVPEFILQRKERCDAILKMLADGDMVIASATLASSANGSDYAWSANRGYDPIFSPVLRDINQRADPDRQEADYDARWPGDTDSNG
jgi:phage gp36-like protein